MVNKLPTIQHHKHQPKQHTKKEVLNGMLVTMYDYECVCLFYGHIRRELLCTCALVIYQSHQHVCQFSMKFGH